MAKKKTTQRKPTKKHAAKESGAKSSAPPTKGGKAAGKRGKAAKPKANESAPAASPKRQKKKAKSAAETSFPIVGIGASAGGLDALRRMLEAVPDEPGVAFVVIQHLDPTRKSLAPELLGKYTKMQVAQIEHDPRVKPNRVYVIPPDKYLSIAGGELHLSKPDRPRGARMAIDFFLRSLAQDQRQCAVGVILSGSGTDGTLGIKAIKAAGGFVVAQDPTSAEFEGMPRSAIDTTIVDHILPPEKIPDVLVRHAKHPYVCEAPAAAPTEEEAESTNEPITDGFNALIALLRAHTKHDFRSYKDKTLVRRTRRRMCLHHIDDYDKYLNYLREHPKEIDTLAKDLLISVTDFFREGEAWEELRRQAIAPLVGEKGSDDPIRVWTPGCATGEEPYSAAMLILEELKKAKKHCPLNIFASDIDKEAIDYARAGRYPKSIAADVSSERLARFFTTDDGDDYYHVNKTLREAVVFADQNLIADPPFSKLDLVCCRNLLIYLKPDVQEKVVALFHFALREGGMLMLGSAETIGRQTDLFQTVDKRWRIFRRIGPTHHDRVDIPLTTSGARREVEPALPPPQRREARLTHLAQQRLLDLLAPSAVLIDNNWRVLYICGDVDNYLTRKAGMPTDNLLDNARRGLRTKLRGVIHTALAEGRTVSTQARVLTPAGYAPVALTVRVIKDRQQEEDLALVVFDSEPRALAAVSKDVQRRPKRDSQDFQATVSDAQTDDEPDLDDDAVVRQLEEELAEVKDDLQATIEQLESSNEEFKASNEEVMSINEELQSTNEELETSKEELQSLNEELSTVNNQLAGKVDELETKHADLENLIAVTDVPTICLDNDMTVRWFTPATQKIVRLKPADRGRPLEDFAHDFTDGDLVDVARSVLKNLTPIEDEVTCRDDRTFLRRATPYRTDDDRIGGVVITFVEITRRKQDEQRLVRELSDTQRLQAVAGQLLPQTDLDTILQEILQAAVDLAGADMGCMQLLDQESQVLHIDAQVGFGPEFLRYFESVTADADSCCGQALSAGKRMIAPDVSSSDLFSDATRQVLLDAGARAVQSTPLASRSGRTVGILSTHWRQPHTPGQRQLGLLDVLSRQAADLIDRAEQIAALRESDVRLRKLNESLEQQIAQRTDMLRLLQDVTQMANEADTVRAALSAAMERICHFNGWQVGHVWRKADDGSDDMVSAGIWYISDQAERAVGQLEKFQQICAQKRYSPGEILIGAVAQSGRPHWIDDIVESKDWRRGDAKELGMHAAIAFPVTVEGQVLAVLEFFSDHPAKRDKRFMEIMPDVGIQLGYVIKRQQTEHSLHESEQRRRAVLNAAPDAIISTDRHGVISDANPAAEQIFGYRKEALIGQNVSMLMPSPFREEHDAYIARYLETREPQIIGVAREVVAQRKDGRVFPIRININDFDHGSYFVAIVHDISLEKELEKQVVDAASEEQRRIAGDIHDGVGQELTGLRYMAQTHAEMLTAQSSDQTETAQRMTEWLETIQGQLRAIIRELVPVEIDEQGLETALRDLAERTSEVHDVVCTFECEQSIVAAEAAESAHMFRIAQEAVRNAVKHAEASQIRIQLTENDGALRLQVDDDGIGIDAAAGRPIGFGLRSMNYRAGLIGATLTCRSKKAGGTRVICTVLGGEGPMAHD